MDMERIEIVLTKENCVKLRRYAKQIVDCYCYCHQAKQGETYGSLGCIHCKGHELTSIDTLH